MKYLLFLYCFIFIESGYSSPLSAKYFAFYQQEEDYFQVVYDSPRVLYSSCDMGSLELFYPIQTKIEEFNNANGKNRFLDQLNCFYGSPILLEEINFYMNEVRELHLNSFSTSNNNFDTPLFLDSISYEITQQENPLYYYFTPLSFVQPKQDFYLINAVLMNNMNGSSILGSGEHDTLDSVFKYEMENLEVEVPQNNNFTSLPNKFVRIQNSFERLSVVDEAIKMDKSIKDIEEIELDPSFITLINKQKEDTQKAKKILNTSYEIPVFIGFDLGNNPVSFLSKLTNKKIESDTASFVIGKSDYLLENNKVSETKKMLFAGEVKGVFEGFIQDLESEMGFFNMIIVITTLLGNIGVISTAFYFHKVRKVNQKMVLDNLVTKIDLEKIRNQKNLVLAEVKKYDQLIWESSSYNQRTNDFLQNFAKKLLEVEKNTNGQSNKHYLDFFKNSGKNSEKLFEEFEFLFLNLDEDFFKQLSEKFPNLSNQELRLCGLVRKRLKNEEIATITGKSLSTLHVSKSRLRKKLGLDNSSQSLEEFFGEQFKN